MMSHPVQDSWSCAYPSVPIACFRDKFMYDTVYRNTISSSARQTTERQGKPDRELVIRRSSIFLNTAVHIGRNILARARFPHWNFRSIGYLRGPGRARLRPSRGNTRRPDRKPFRAKMRRSASLPNDPVGPSFTLASWRQRGATSRPSPNHAPRLGRSLALPTRLALPT